MSDTPAMPSERELDQLLYAVADALDVPPMTDSAARARRRIEARGATERPQEPLTPLDLPQDDRAAAFQPKEILQLPLDEQESTIRQFALLAAGLAAAAIVGVVLTFAFRGFGDDDRIVDYWPASEFEDHPLAVEPYDIPGYEFVGAIGHPAVPNEPVDVAIGPDGTQFVLDLGLRRVVAFTEDGEIRSDWGDEGFSTPISDLGVDSVGVDANGQVFVALSREVLVFDATGQQVDSWPFPETADNETRIRRSQGLVVDSTGNVYVAGRGVIWRFAANAGTATTIEIGSETDIQLDIDSQDQLYAASWPGGIYRVSAAGELEFVGRTASQEDINGFAVAPDGRIIVFRSSSSASAPSTFIILDSDGAETASWPINRAGSFMGNLGPYWIGVDVAADGTIVLPDYLGHRLSSYNPEGTLVSEIRDEAPDAFGRLWRISVDGAGNVLGYDPSVEPRVLRFSPEGELQQEMPFESALLGSMATLFEAGAFAATLDGGFIIAGQTLNDVSVYSPEGELVERWGASNLPEDQSGLAFPDAIAVDDDGFVYIVDEGFSGRLVDNLRKFTSDGEFVTEIGSIGYPQRADLAYQDSAIWAIDDGTILRFPSEGGEPREIAGPATQDHDGDLPGYPITLALDGQGNILTYMYKLDSGPGQFSTMLAKLDPQGNIIWTADLDANSANRYVDLAIADDGTLYLSDSELRQIFVYRPTTETRAAASTEPAPVKEPLDSISGRLVVKEIVEPGNTPQYALVGPDILDRHDLPPGELVGISPDGTILLLIDQEPGEEHLRLDLIAVSTERFEELWRTDIGQHAESGPNTRYFDTAIAGDSVYVAIHDPDFRRQMLEVAQISLASGELINLPGTDTDVDDLERPQIDIDLLVMPDSTRPVVIVRDGIRHEIVVESALVNKPASAQRGMPVGTPRLLRQGNGVYFIPPNGFATAPAIQYLLFEGMTLGEITLPFAADGNGSFIEYAVANDAQALYALSLSESRIVIVDLERLAVETTVALDDIPIYSLTGDTEWTTLTPFYAGQSISFSLDGRYLYCLGYPRNHAKAITITPSVWKIDTATWSVVDDWEPEAPWVAHALSSDHPGDEIYVSLGTIAEVDDRDAQFRLTTADPGFLVLSSDSLDDYSDYIDLVGYEIIGTLDDMYRDPYGVSPT